MTSLADVVSAVARDLPGEYVDMLVGHLEDVPGPSTVGRDAVARPQERGGTRGSAWGQKGPREARNPYPARILLG